MPTSGKTYCNAEIPSVSFGNGRINAPAYRVFRPRRQNLLKSYIGILSM